jgi:hypothetical protein
MKSEAGMAVATVTVVDFVVGNGQDSIGFKPLRFVDDESKRFPKGGRVPESLA